MNNIVKNAAAIIGGLLILILTFFMFSGDIPKTKEISKDITFEQEIRNSSIKYGNYEDYTLEKIKLAETGNVVLFFHASWCPSCRALNSDIENNREDIPAEVTILKLNYDSETELKQKYGVTTQHTLVQVDKEGNIIKKWSGGSKLANLISQIN